ncbi:3'-5' exoribonuclease [Marivirga sp. S37H4]|uniref:3'-5' exoribonuclease n=1 Tax=Marivirga aurantiaca TaxID=2802615 RepID=A0A934X161_9BACT|nr:exonuclease domain-containing protein [Marivirga aurantiaca]MBK6266557.1 3'-5' exoribonuclease [Marivirga aurantiaca]
MKFNFWRNSKKTNYPEEITNYFAVNKPGVEADTSYVVFDTESSSLTISSAQLLSIGAVKVKDNSIALRETFECFIHTGKSGVKGNVHIHEIMATGKEEKKEVKEALLEFLDFIGNAVLVAHHAKHDVGLINRYLSENFPGVRLVNQVIDTANLAIENDRKKDTSIKIEPENYSLDALLKRYSIEALERHTALGDAFSTALLFLKMK